jgi:iron(II)-dependent oxidoreductase
MIFGTDDPNRDRPFEPISQTVPSRPFAIAQTEVTNRLYRLCVEAEACDKPKDTRFFDDDALAQHPVVFVTASQAAAYCAWLDQRLPTEFEWERAARGSNGRAWPWGTEPPTADRANLLFSNTAPQGTLPVGILDAGVSPEGVYDLIGNVAEWTSTTLQCDADTCTRGAWDSKDSTAVLAIRGGGFSSSDFVRSTLTLGATPDSYDGVLGFRCAK